MENRKLNTGFYRPTTSFKSIPEHIAVMFDDDQTLVAIVGASDDDPKNLIETLNYARLFSAAPELLQFARDVKVWFDGFGEHSPVVYGGEDVFSERARLLLASVDSNIAYEIKEI